MTQEKQLLFSETKFGLDFLKTQLKNESFVFSPLSVSFALALVHSGAKGQSATEIEKVLLDGVEREELVNYYSKLFKSLKTTENGTEVNVANRVYLRENVEINSSYLADVQQSYEAGAELLDFQSTDSAEKINAFIRSATQGNLDNLVTSDSISDAVALLVNAIYFQGKWQDDFDSQMTMDKDFTTVSGEVKQIPFLAETMTDRLYTSDDTFRVLIQNYKDPEYRFAIFLPKVFNGLGDALQKLDAERFQTLLKKAERTYMDIEFPKFTVEKELQLKDVLHTLGVTEIFSDQADLSGVAEGIKVSDGIHKALIDVNEEGTTASAATVFKVYPMCGRMADPIEFKANHPFLFALVKDDHPLFLGVFHG
uniref:SERPIN domain-containing protein n=1 Tax=Caenorhabditis tropicalis TaxID=1561998 RepID=A0A1I7V284_9PELO